MEEKSKERVSVTVANNVEATLDQLDAAVSQANVIVERVLDDCDHEIADLINPLRRKNLGSDRPRALLASGCISSQSLLRHASRDSSGEDIVDRMDRVIREACKEAAQNSRRATWQLNVPSILRNSDGLFPRLAELVEMCHGFLALRVNIPPAAMRAMRKAHRPSV